MLRPKAERKYENLHPEQGWGITLKGEIWTFWCENGFVGHPFCPKVFSLKDQTMFLDIFLWKKSILLIPKRYANFSFHFFLQKYQFPLILQYIFCHSALQNFAVYACFMLFLKLWLPHFQRKFLSQILWYQLADNYFKVWSKVWKCTPRAGCTTFAKLSPSPS